MHVAVARREVSALWVIEVMCTVSDGVRCGRDGCEVWGRSGGFLETEGDWVADGSGAGGFVLVE